MVSLFSMWRFRLLLPLIGTGVENATELPSWFKNMLSQNLPFELYVSISIILSDIPTMTSFKIPKTSSLFS